MTKYNLTPVEHELMDILWKIEEGTVRDVMAHLPLRRNLAYTSVSTMLRILEQKKILKTRKSGRTHIYVPALSKSTFAALTLNKMVNQVFSGNSVELVSYLVNKNNLSQDEMTEIQKIIENKKKELER